jgi:hypothetical protein
VTDSIPSSAGAPDETDEVDTAVLRRAQRGDAEACRALIERYQDRVFAELSRRLADPAAIEDVARETFLQVLRELAGFPALGPARPSARILAVAAQRAGAAGSREPGSQVTVYAVPVPDGFAAVVVERHRALPTSRRRRFALGPLPRVAWLVPAACAVALVVMVVRGAAPPVAGEARVESRRSIALGGRGTAVAEPGAALRWRVTGGSARIEQSAGAVFYRIEAGGPLQIATAAGDVRAADSCVTVDMAAGQVTVVVHQGSAIVASGGDERTVAAGERVRLDVPR